jgi:hypothetical protein
LQNSASRISFFQEVACNFIGKAHFKAMKTYHENQERFEDYIPSRPSYIASTLQSAGLISGYYDLYTTPPQPLNIYFSELQGKLGFKNVNTARYSVDVLEGVYRRFANRQDRAGQHHCLATALTMFNRARFSGKMQEALIFKTWLMHKLNETEQRPPYWQN